MIDREDLRRFDHPAHRRQESHRDEPDDFLDRGLAGNGTGLRICLASAVLVLVLAALLIGRVL